MTTKMPTADQLLLAANAYEQFQTSAAQIIRESGFSRENEAIKNAQPLELAQLLIPIFDQAWDQIHAEADLSAIQWLEEQPAFRMAYDSLGFIELSDEEQLERLADRIERRASSRFSPWQLTRFTGHYLRYVSGVSLELYNYVTRRGVSATVNGPGAVKRMTDLMTEFQRLASEDCFPPESQKALLSYSNRMLDRLLRSDLLPPTLTRRNDKDLPARLVATGLIRLHFKHFGEARKRAVFHLMGLPFIERPLEMRTIERLIKGERERYVTWPLSEKPNIS